MEREVVCRDSPTMLDLVEETLDQIAPSIEITAKADWLVVVIAFWRDVCPSAALSDESSDPIGVNSTISEQHRSRFQVGQQREDKTVVMRLAWSARHEQAAHWYRRPRESWSSIRLATGPSVVHCSQRCRLHADARAQRMYQSLHGRIMARGQRIHKLIPHASPAPSNKAIVAGDVGAKVLRQIAPRRN